MAKKTVKKTKKENDQKLIAIITAVILVMMLVITVFQLGAVGIFFTTTFKYLFGVWYLIPLLSLTLGIIYLLFFKEKMGLRIRVLLGVLFINLSILVLASVSVKGVTGLAVLTNYIGDTGNFFLNANAMDFKGGLVGSCLYAFSSLLFAEQGSIVFGLALLLIGLLLAVKLEFYRNIYAGVREKKNNFDQKKALKEAEAAMAVHEKEAQKTVLQRIDLENNEQKRKSIFMEPDANSSEKVHTEPVRKMESTPIVEPKTSSMGASNSLGKYVLPSMSVLDPAAIRNKNSVNESSAKIKAAKVIEILHNFGIKSELIATHIGPAVTKFEVKPDSSVKVSKISQIQDNIKMELAARDIRIEAPIPGRNAVGIEIPNVEPIPVRMIELIKSVPVDKKDKKMLFVLGKDLMGTPIFCELDKMPHLLVAGATGSGKSVCMNTIITSFLLRTTPDEVKLLLVDPKKVEFTPYHNVPHLIGPVISDAQEASNALKIIVQMMENRFDVFAKCGVRNIQGYNDKLIENPDEKLKKMPYIVVIIDELADLMAIAGKDVEMSIQRITQLARASGIHLIVATQRPSTDVITGIIKSNIPSRIAFSVASGIDSRTIIDGVGAERLLGNGDMLYLPIGEPSVIRLQGTYVSDAEVKRITDYVKTQGIPMYDDAFIRIEGVTSADDNSILRANDDPLYDEIKTYVVEQQKASTSLLQRRFGIGYNRAARMIDILEENGIIGPPQGSKPRDVYIKKDVDIDE